MNYPLIAVIVIAVLAILYFMNKQGSASSADASNISEGLEPTKDAHNMPNAHNESGDMECEGGVCKRKPKAKKEKMD